MFHCRTSSASTAPCTSRRMCCPTHCATVPRVSGSCEHFPDRFDPHLLRQVFKCHNRRIYRGTSLTRTPPPQDPTVALCLGTYGDPMGVGVSHERGTPVISILDISVTQENSAKTQPTNLTTPGMKFKHVTQVLDLDTIQYNCFYRTCTFRHAFA